MKDEIKDILEQNAKEYYKNALEAEGKKEYNSAVTLFFKAIASLADLFVLVKEGKIPSNHTERFRILESKYKEVYNILDKDFPFYQNSYFQKLSKELAEVIKNDAKVMADETKVEIF